MTKILLVDDEPDIIEFIKYNLEQENYNVIVSYDGKDALKKVHQKPDLVILDIMMPEMDGFEVCIEIRKQHQFQDLPIIFLTAKSSEKDEIKGLELGAIDYIQKPISPRKLIARVKTNLTKHAVLSEKPVKHKTISLGPISIDPDKFVVLLDGKKKTFPKKEFNLLYYLVNNPGTVHTREELLKEVWGTDVFVVDRTVDVHIRKIREKLDAYSNLIETVKGVGYRFKSVE
jgi:two-component system, OmpR family, alkaline phosphatase synthesis response regulator PhoP